jgi:hypothetical protein
MSSVCPSGADRATISIATLPAAPLRLSTTHCSPIAAPSFGVSTRASASIPPPGGYGSTSLIGREGYGRSAAAAAAALTRLNDMTAAIAFAAQKFLIAVDVRTSYYTSPMSSVAPWHSCHAGIHALCRPSPPATTIMKSVARATIGTVAFGSFTSIHGGHLSVP